MPLFKLRVTWNNAYTLQSSEELEPKQISTYIYKGIESLQQTQIH